MIASFSWLCELFSVVEIFLSEQTNTGSGCGKPIVAIFNRWIFQLKESISVQFNSNLCTVYFFCGSTSGFAFNTFCILYTLVCFNAIASVQPSCFYSRAHLAFNTVNYLFRSTRSVFVQQFIAQRLNERNW